MKQMTGCAAIFAAVMTIAPLPMGAQQGPGAMQGQRRAAPEGPGVEMILRQRERLELSQSQVDQLDKIREEAVQRRAAHQAQMAEVRSKMLAGEMKPAELRAQMESRRTAAAEVRTQQRERVESVLNDTQKQKVQSWLGQARAFRMGRMSAMRGQHGAMRGPRGAMRGQRGTMRGRAGRMGPGMNGQGSAPGARQGPWMRGGLGQRQGAPGDSAGFTPGSGFGFGPPDGFGPPMAPPAPDTANPSGTGR